LPGGNAVTGIDVPEPYKGYGHLATRSSILTEPIADPTRSLEYTAFAYGAPTPLFIQPSSKTNLALAPYLLNDPLATPKISASYSGSKVTSFDAESIVSGCYAAAQNGILAPAISCTIRYTGTKAVTGEEVIFDAAFEVTTLNLLGIAIGPQTVQKKSFPKQFRGITSLKPRVLTAALPAGALTAQMAFDDFVYTAYTRQ